jgi:hypothetical protein
VKENEECFGIFFFKKIKWKINQQTCAGVGPVPLDHSQINSGFCAWKCILKL